MTAISAVLSQGHGHSHYPGADPEPYSSHHQDVEEGEKEKMQQNGEAGSRALDKMDAGEGELMLSPAQTPQVRRTVVYTGAAQYIVNL